MSLLVGFWSLVDEVMHTEGDQLMAALRCDEQRDLLFGGYKDERNEKMEKVAGLVAENLSLMGGNTEFREYFG
jgi:c-di-GMP-related signal transduction protein